MTRRYPRGPWRAVAFAALISLCACSTTPRHPSLRSQFDDAGYRRLVAAIASYEFEGRRPGSAGADRAVAYLIETLRRFGAKPGNHGSYRQEVPMVAIEPAAPPTLSVTADRGGLLRSAVAPADAVLWTPRESGRGMLRQSRIVFVGYGIDAPTRGWDDYAGVDVRGATVLVLDGEPAGWTARNAGPAGPLALVREKLAVAAAHGAAGVLLIHRSGPLAVPWAAIVNRYGHGLIEAPATDGHGADAGVEGWIRSRAARRWFAAAGASFDAAVADADRPGFRARPLGLAADANVQATVRHFTSPNLVAIVPGGERRHEFLVYSTRWDGLGIGAGRDAGQVLPGAIDDATGTAGWLILAQSFANAVPRPARSIVFLATTGGEYGAIGARYYVAHPIYPLVRTVADVNLALLHVGGPTRDVDSLGPTNSPLEPFLKNAADLQGRVVRPDPQPLRDRYLRSDAAVFAAHGVPALYAIGGLDDAAMGPVWGAARLDDYYARRYQRPGDGYAPSWHLRGTLLDLRLYEDVGRRIARASRRHLQGKERHERRDGSRRPLLLYGSKP
ncbi:MAG: M28 family peptidase [Gammaproteobacteria bacterium]|nr:M28 family peptidase [Gammaproteobacteria bacterium]